MLRLRALLGLLLVTALVAGGSAAYAATGPVAVIRTPTPNLLVDAMTTVMVTGHVVADGTEPVVRVEVSPDGGVTWENATGDPDAWMYDFTPGESGSHLVLARAVAASTTGDPASVTVQVGGPTLPPPPVACECVFDMVNRPLVPHDDTQPVELGLGITFDRDGYLTGALIRRAAYTGELVVRVYRSSGARALSVTAPPGTGVQRVMFPSPLPVLRWSYFTLSYYTPAGGYAASQDYFSGLLAQSPFRASEGRYHYGVGGGYPDQTYRNSNYWIMPIFNHGT